MNVAAELLNNRAEINAQTKAGYTPLHVACHFGQMNMVRFLIENGALVSAQTKANYTPLHQVWFLFFLKILMLSTLGSPTRS